jgi:hypothetical protein
MTQPDWNRLTPEQQRAAWEQWQRSQQQPQVPPYAPPQWHQQPVEPAAPAKPQQNVVAIVGIVCAVLAWIIVPMLFGVAAIACGIAADVVERKRTGHTSKLGVAALVLGALGAILPGMILH